MLSWQGNLGTVSLSSLFLSVLWGSRPILSAFGAEDLGSSPSRTIRVMVEKELVKEAFAQGYELGYGVEELSRMDEKVIENQFEQWWSTNHDE